jgi:hypothetical protein
MRDPSFAETSPSRLKAAACCRGGRRWLSGHACRAGDLIALDSVGLGMEGAHVLDKGFGDVGW